MGEKIFKIRYYENWKTTLQLKNVNKGVMEFS